MNRLCYMALLQVGVMLMAAGETSAAGLQHSVSVPVTWEHDSNPALLSTSEKGITRAIVAPSYSLTGVWGADEIRAGLSLRAERSSDEAISMNRNDPSAQVSWQHQLERGSWELAARYDEASVRSAELQESTWVPTDGTRKSSSVKGSWRHEFGERSSMVADAEYKAVTYSAVTLSDFDNPSLGILYNHALSVRSDLFVRLAMSQYVPQNSSVASSDNATLILGIKQMHSQQLDWTLQLGTSQVSGASRSESGQGGVTVNFHGLRSNFQFDLGRTTVASGEGGYVVSDQARAVWTYDLDEFGRIGADYLWRKTLGVFTSTIQQATVWFGRELSPRWNSRFYLQRRVRSQDGLSDANSNVVGASLIYNFANM